MVCIEGNVGTITSQKTSNNTPACSFFLASERENGADPVWNRINVYGALAVLCKEQLAKGNHVVVYGEIMNRPLSGGGDLVMCDVRGHKVIFVDSKKTKHRGYNDDE